MSVIVADTQKGCRRPESVPQSSDVITVVPGTNTDISPLPTSDDSMGVMPSLVEGAGVDSTTIVVDTSGVSSGVARRLGVGSRLGGTRLRIGLSEGRGWEGGVVVGGKERGVD